jgi:hypothetical protein
LATRFVNKTNRSEKSFCSRIAPFNVNGVTFPLQDEDVLIPFEKSAIATATFAYNASITSIAKKTGVSFATVSRALNSPEKVKPDTLKKIRNENIFWKSF